MDSRRSPCSCRAASISSLMVWICRRLAPVARTKKSYRGVIPRISRTNTSRPLFSVATCAARQARSREVEVRNCSVAWVAILKRPPSESYGSGEEAGQLRDGDVRCFTVTSPFGHLRTGSSQSPRNNKPQKAPRSLQSPNRCLFGLSHFAYHLARRQPRQAFSAPLLRVWRFGLGLRYQL